MKLEERVSEMAREIAFDIERKVSSLLSDVAKASDERAADRVEQAIRSALSGMRGDVAIDESESVDASQEAAKQPRVPKGTVEPFVDRVLKEMSPEGIELEDVLSFAETENEKLVKEPSVLSCLRRKEGAKYRKDGKLWFWSGDKQEMKSAAKGDDLRNGTSKHAYSQEGIADAVAS